MLALWTMRQPLLAALDQLPACFCHHDAFRRNLMLRKMADDSFETVAFDWSYTGPGKIGQEIGVTTGVALVFIDVAASDAAALDEAVFGGYCAGLRDAGWQGDLKLARYGYTMTAAFACAITLAAFRVIRLQSAEGRARFESITRRPIDEAVEHWRETQLFLLALGDEALRLMESL